MITTQELMVTRMLMFMMEHCAMIANEAHEAVEWEKENFYAHAWCCNDCIIEQCGVNNLPYIGIEPGIA